MQTTNQPSSQSAKSNPFVRILAIIGGLVVAFCICGILGVAFMRLLGRSAADVANQKVIVPTAVVQPVASQPVVGATIQFISPTETKAPVATATPALGKTRDHPLPMD